MNKALKCTLSVFNTALLKGKLTVLTRNSIPDCQSFLGSRTKFGGLSFEFRDTQEFFEDLQQRFQGNNLIE